MPFIVAVPVEGVRDAIIGATYKFIGGSNETGVDLSDEDYLDDTRWELCSAEKDEFGAGGTFYKYIGSDSAEDLDLSTQDYTDNTKWEQVKRDLATEEFSNETYWAKCASITALSAAASLSAGVAGITLAKKNTSTKHRKPT